MLWITRVRRREEGAVAVIVALMLVVFMACVALAVDVGGLYLRRRELVNGSDAAALSAARTARWCSDLRFLSDEEAADYQVQQNAPITNDEVAGTNIIPAESTQCGLRWGHVTVQYTSEQSLFFAPVLGFDHQSPVTTKATASWGLGSNNPVPLVLSNTLVGTCKDKIPPSTPTPSLGATCALWYDNNDLHNGNFGYIGLSPQGWDVPKTDNCSGAQPGTNLLTDWILGNKLESVSLNWTFPTYVCSSSGFHTGGGSGQGFDALRSIAGQSRDFPITWEGCLSGSMFVECAPPGSSTPQGVVYQSNNIQKYDVIGFARMKVINVYRRNDQEVQGTTTTTMTPWPASNYNATQCNNSPTCSTARFTLNTVPPTGTVLTFSWTGRQINNNQARSGTCTVNIAGKAIGAYTWNSLGNGSQCPSNQIALNNLQPTAVTVMYPVTTFTPGVCGTQIPSDNSAICVLLEYHGSTLTNDYNDGHDTDSTTVVRLCDLGLGNCLDQRRGP